MLYDIIKLGFSVLLGLLLLWSWDPNQILWSLYYLARDTPWPVGRPWGTDVALRSPTLTSSTQRYTDSQTHRDTQMPLIQILKQTDTQTHRDTQILRYSNTKTHKRTATNTQKHRDTSTDTYRLNNIPVSLCIHHNDPPHFVWFRFLLNVSHCDHVPGFQQNCKNQLEMILSTLRLWWPEGAIYCIYKREALTKQPTIKPYTLAPTSRPEVE